MLEYLFGSELKVVNNKRGGSKRAKEGLRLARATQTAFSRGVGWWQQWWQWWWWEEGYEVFVGTSWSSQAYCVTEKGKSVKAVEKQTTFSMCYEKGKSVEAEETTTPATHTSPRTQKHNIGLFHSCWKYVQLSRRERAKANTNTNTKAGRDKEDLYGGKLEKRGRKKGNHNLHKKE